MIVRSGTDFRCERSLELLISDIEITATKLYVRVKNEFY